MHKKQYPGEYFITTENQYLLLEQDLGQEPVRFLWILYAVLVQKLPLIDVPIAHNMTAIMTKTLGSFAQMMVCITLFHIGSQ